MIDWFTVIAQIVNFLILVGLLKVFLYNRILAAMDHREREIAARWREADQQRNDAAKELEQARQTNQRIDQQREQLLAKVRQEVETHKQELIAKVRDDVDQIRERWSIAIQEETDSFLRELEQRTIEQVCGIARAALADLAGANLQQQMIDRFLDELDRLDERDRQSMISSLNTTNRQPKGASGEAVVQTTCALDADQREVVAAALRRELGGEFGVRFEQSKDLLCGIALQTNSHKLGWNLGDYLGSLQQELGQMLEEETAAPPKRFGHTPARP